MNNNPYGLAALWTKGDLLIKSVAVLLLLSITSWYVIATCACRAIGLRRPARAGPPRHQQGRPARPAEPGRVVDREPARRHRRQRRAHGPGPGDPGFGGLDGTVRRAVRHRLGHLPRAGGLGVSGQASIDKVAGPVGEALIMVDAADLESRLREAASREPQPKIHIRGDPTVQYERVIKVMAAAQRAGILKLGFITEPGS